ncbi:amino acid permease [Caldibacillus lycopersici]|uniref:Amino acid permease n=1 Tax=Perspicuibacillus lycopersici TaxID=1325689 RepID=A0AAE3IS33_9BACI|nr:amino acid permease [Perspicuibacillus lycopersici]MCU9613598.1 amino acid permease [Perspicuibacillus lycopersici]
MGKNKGKKLKWWQLSILGIGFIIGTGFFLGSTIAIRSAGPAVVITFFLAAVGTYIVYDVLGRMTALDPQEGSFSYYSKKAYGHWAGFSSGWVYWSSEMLIMGSQMTGISIFTRFWFENIPIWIFASVYTVLAIGIVLVGIKWFERIGNVFAFAKLSAIIMFIILALLALFGVLKGDTDFQKPTTLASFIPYGWKGMWAALLFSFYAYGGIEIMGIYATRLKDPKDTPKSGKFMLMLLTIIYILSVGLAIILVPLRTFNMEESPFVVALHNFHLAFVPHVFNGILIIAGFSTMTASLFAVTTMLVNLAKDGDAPARLGKGGKLAVPLPALAMTTSGLIISIVLGLLLPDQVYEYITTAAGLMLLYNWLFILFSSKKLLKVSMFDHVKRYLGTILILLAVTGSIFHGSSRPGFFISLFFLVIIGGITILMNRKWKKGGSKPTGIYQIINGEKEK